MDPSWGITSNRSRNRSRRNKGMAPSVADIPTPMPRGASKTEVFQASLRTGIIEGDLLNTKLYAYTRRNMSGAVDKPRAVYANEAALKSASDYFVTLFQWDFQEGQMSTDDYDYMSDSDLDDAEDGVTEHSKNPATEQGTSCTRPVIGMDIPAPVLKSGVTTPTSAEDGSGKGAPHEEPDSDTARSRVVVDSDIPIVLQTVAFRTLQSFVFWSLTGKIAFAPLRSEPSSAHLEHGSKHKKPYDPPECSPKSMYRFAHLCGINELKKEALKDLTSKLTSSNVWIELFSSLTARYPEVQEAEINRLVDNIRLKSEVLGALPQWLTRVASGELGPQSGDVVAKLIERIA